MPKAEIKALILGTPSPSLSRQSSPRTPTLPSLSAAISHYKDSLMKVKQAQGRKRVLQRQLQKKKSTTLNAQRHNDYAQYIKQSAELDRYIKQWNDANRLQKLDQQSFINRQSKLRIKNNIENSRSFFHANNAHKRQSLKEESELNEKSLKDFQEELSNSRIKQRKISQKQEKKRQEQISAFHTRKQQQIRNEKQRQIRQLFSHSQINHSTVNQLVQRNYSLKNRRYREEKAAKRLKADQLPINLASTIKNPQIYAE